ncbi:hypothetical protein K502DRAFT_364606 [Neoconidiobolus thromboides FSU 785]|nr:hypothetical protein K502DRAFT_364606 [Neoconidiobolus thromboides FSU 785]
MKRIQIPKPLLIINIFNFIYATNIQQPKRFKKADVTEVNNSKSENECELILEKLKLLANTNDEMKMKNFKVLFLKFLNYPEFKNYLTELKWESMDEEIVLEACQLFLDKAELSNFEYESLITTILLPKFFKQVMYPRDLIHCLNQFFNQRPLCSINGIILPMILNKKLNEQTFDIISKAMTLAYNESHFEKLIEEITHCGSDKVRITDDIILSLFQFILMKLNYKLNSKASLGLLNLIVDESLQINKNIKLSNLLLSILKNALFKLSEELKIKVVNIVNKNQTYLKRSLLKEINKY